MSMVTLSWTIHTGHILQEPQQSTTNPDHTKATMPGQVPDTTVKVMITFLQISQLKSS